MNLWRQNDGILSLNGAKIVPLSEVSDAVKNIVALVHDYSIDDPYVSYGCNFLLQVERKFRQNEMTGEAEKTLNMSLAVFKLFKDAVILPDVVIVGERGVIRYRHYIHYSRTQVGRYQLSRDEESKFVNFWKEHDGIDASNFSVLRYVLADYRPYLRDRLADYVFSLEYLLVPESKGQEISYKFSSRGALLFGEGNAPEERNGSTRL